MKKARAHTKKEQTIALVIVLLLVVATILIACSLVTEDTIKAYADGETTYYNYTLTINSFYIPGEKYGTTSGYNEWFINEEFHPYEFIITNEEQTKVLTKEKYKLNNSIDAGRYVYYPKVGNTYAHFWQSTWNFTNYTEGTTTKKAAKLEYVNDGLEFYGELKYTFNFSSTDDLSGIKIKVIDLLTDGYCISSTQTPCIYTLTQTSSTTPTYTVNDLETGYIEGYQEGYTAGANNEYQNAFDEGYNVGVIAGEEASQTEAYNNGYEQGSYDVNLSLGSVIGNSFGAIGDFIMTILSIEVAGISLWAILAALGAIIIIGIVIKLVI